MVTKPRKKRVTIFDIANYVGVSPSTVSRALTGNVTVAPDKLAAIFEAIEKLGYRPNEFARSLANGTSKVVGVLTQHFASPFYGNMLTGVEAGLRESGYSPMIISGNWQLTEELRALDIFLEQRVAGIIFLGGDIPDERFRELAEELPFILAGRTIPGLEPYCLQVDNAKGAYLATQHLIALGHTAIAHVSGISSHADSVARLQGFQQAMKDANLPLNPRLLVQGDFRPQSGIMALENLLTPGVPFTSIFVANDQMAQGVMLGLYRHGMRIPDRVSIVSFDDQPESQFSRPPLTTIRYPSFEMGFAAAAGVLNLLAGKEPDLPLLSTELIVRASTAQPGALG
jgi:LacI family transcriptional regulator